MDAAAITTFGMEARSRLSSDQIRIASTTDAGWSAVESVMQSVASARSCWCQFHVLANAHARSTTRDSRKELLQQQVADLDPPRGLVAFAGDEPVGWCGVEPRLRLQHVLASRLVAKSSLFPADADDVWMVYCLLVPQTHRRRGIARMLLATAISHARSHGAQAIEGLPIDTAVRNNTLPEGFSTGTLEMFLREGFEPGAALPSGRTLVWRTLVP